MKFDMKKEEIPRKSLIHAHFKLTISISVNELKKLFANFPH